MRVDGIHKSAVEIEDEGFHLSESALNLEPKKKGRRHFHPQAVLSLLGCEFLHLHHRNTAALSVCPMSWACQSWEESYVRGESGAWSMPYSTARAEGSMSASGVGLIVLNPT